MRLIRLLSEPPTNTPLVKSEYENYFKDNIIIKANSKIGLLNASIPVNYKDIYINSTAKKYQFKTAANQPNYREVDLGGDNVYSVSEFVTLFNTQSWKLLDFANRADIGCVIKLATRGKKFIIQSFRLRNIGILADAQFTIQRNIAINADDITRQTGGNDNTAFIFSRLPALMSCSFYRLKITNVGNLIIGLTNLVDGAVISQLDDAMVKYGIKIDNASQHYYYIDENQMMVQVDAATAVPTANDVISLDVEQGKMNYRLYRGNNLLAEFYSFDIDQSQILHFCAGLRTGNLDVGKPSIFYDPLFQVNTLNEIVKQEPDYDVYGTINDIDDIELGLGALPVPPTNLQQSQHFIQFPQEDFRKILGFDIPDLYYQGISTTFVAQTEYNVLSVPSTLLVELPSIKLNSYDGLIGNRRNILAVLPNNLRTSERLLYSVEYPLMLDIDNQYDINLRSIRARIVNGDDDGSLLDVFDRIELTLLID